MPWTEQIVERRALSAEHQTQLGATQLPELHNTGLVAIDPEKPDVISSVVNTGLEFQQRLKNNPMNHLNTSPRQFADTCRQLYVAQKDGQVPATFSVLLLATDPLHFDARRSLSMARSPHQARQYFGKARPVRQLVGQNQYLYTLEIQVVGARVSDLLKDDLPGLSLAAAVASREIIENTSAVGLAGECAGSVIKGISDVTHLDTVLAVADELRSGRDRGLLRLVSQTTGETPATIAELAHTHDLSATQAAAVSQQLVSKSTALSPLTEPTNREDIFMVHPQLTQPVVIIPFWDELLPAKAISATSETSSAALASIALGSLATFGVEGLNQITTQLVEPSNAGTAVPLSAMQRIL